MLGENFKDNLKNTIAQVVNAILDIKDSSTWGEGTTTCASDSKKFGAWDQNLMIQWHIRSSKVNIYVSEIPKIEAKEMGTEGNFWDKYPDIVKVYTIIDGEGKVWSKEICGGPHVQDTSKLGEFSIIKEQSSSAGIRRIKGVIKPVD